MLDDAPFKASDLMTRDVAVVHPDTSLADATRLMASRHISGVPVVDNAGDVVGMLSEGDLVRWHDYSQGELRWLDLLAEGHELAPVFLEGIRDQRRKVKSVMSSGVTSVTEETSARDIARLMHAKNIKRVPVLHDGKLVGIVARSDLVRALAAKLKELPPPGRPPQTIDEALRHGREESLHGSRVGSA
jgi:CBS domain-containing protein